MTSEQILKPRGKIPPDHRCARCGSSETRMKGKYHVWHKYDTYVKGKQGHICENCRIELSKKPGGRFKISKDRRCTVCGTDKSVECSTGQNHWYKYKDGYVCRRCHSIVKRTEPPRWQRIPPDRKCSKCDSSETEIDKKGHAYWAKDGNGGFLCRKCYRKKHYKDSAALEKRRARGRRSATKRRQNLSEEEKKEYKKYLKQYRKNNYDKLRESRHTEKHRKRDRENKKLPHVKQARNKRLKKNRYFETDRPWGYNKQQEFRSRAKAIVEEFDFGSISSEQLEERMKKISENGISILYINRIPFDRKCSKCGSSKTEVDKKGQAHWAKDGQGGFWCRNCYRKMKKIARTPVLI